ncbi:hypothetical protein V6N13_125892 [Hibiscus sabdariffa]|uniref:Uncharacterized protein n=1 Tax=Hibiscus sabdariffa TaxID=183260 RepID=A0ABR2NX16_9ROSI
MSAFIAVANITNAKNDECKGIESRNHMIKTVKSSVPMYGEMGAKRRSFSTAIRRLKATSSQKEQSKHTTLQPLKRSPTLVLLKTKKLEKL